MNKDLYEMTNLKISPQRTQARFTGVTKRSHWEYLYPVLQALAITIAILSIWG